MSIDTSTWYRPTNAFLGVDRALDVINDNTTLTEGLLDMTDHVPTADSTGTKPYNHPKLPPLHIVAG